MAAAAAEIDRFGLSWRGELAAGILTNLHRVDCLEVIADDYMDASPVKVDGLVALARQVPVSLHAIQLGLCTLEGLPDDRLRAVARLVERIRPESWSEHLAIVRGGGREIGHLAPQSRTAGTVAATLENLARVEQAVGLAPAIENIATLVDPPGSTLSEADWLAAILAGGRNALLLDLHNVYSNAVNFGFDPLEFLSTLPLHRVGTIHLAGGKALAEGRWLDDHKNPVPAPVFALLEFVAARVRRPLTVILERDGAYSGVGGLLAELDAAREAVRRGRAQPIDHRPRPHPSMEPDRLEDRWQERLTVAYLSGDGSGLPGEVDGEGLRMAARSFARKRQRAAT